MRGGVRLCLAVVLLGCHAARNAQHASPASAFIGIDGARFAWLEAECNDTALDLAELGFERELSIAVDEGALQLTFDTEIATRGCAATALWTARPSETPRAWSFEPRATVVLPVDADCGAVETAPTAGSLRLFDDTLELVTHDSPWCRGFDARFVFQRVPQKQLSTSQVVMHYAAAFNSRDPRAVAKLFDDNGSLIEPFTRTDDGNYKRHEGRAAVRDWYASALSSAPWVALRLLAIEPLTDSVADASHVVARWEYMDGGLAEPLRGRNLFVVAGGEIYETELQLVSDPKPTPDEPAAAAPAAHVGEGP